MAWLHFFQDSKDQSKTSPTAKYKGTSFPSTFLINKKGIIVAENSELRKERLLKTLEKYVN